MPILLIALSALTSAVFLATVLRSRRTAPVDAPTVDRRGTRRTERISGRILFVDRREDHLVLDCVAGWSHPSLCSLAPGTPFALTVEPAGPAWFGDAVESMVARWAEEDALVDFHVVVDPDGERVDVQGERSRVRLEVRRHAGLG